MSIEDPKFQKVVPNTAKVIYTWDKKILSFSKNSKFCKQEIDKNDHIIDIHVNTEVLPTGLHSLGILRFFFGGFGGAQVFSLYCVLSFFVFYHGVVN